MNLIESKDQNVMQSLILVVCLLLNIPCYSFHEEKTSLKPMASVFQKLHHLAVIPDGNRRWAAANNHVSCEGHRKGFLTVMPEITEKLFSAGLHTLTFWFFSTENWDRSPDEITDLMTIFEEGLTKLLQIAHRDRVKMIHLGRKCRLPQFLLECIEQVELETSKYDQHYFNFALDYGGRDEITRAIQILIRDEAVLTDGKIIDYEQVSSHLDTKHQPYPCPDLVIRTSGEQRISGFMLWQIAYSEFYFESCYFPDFTWLHLEKALNEYIERQRRFGK